MGFTIKQCFLVLYLLAAMNGCINAIYTEFDLFVLSRNIDYNNGVELCRRNGMNLVRIEDENTNQMVYNFAVQRNIGPYWIEGKRGLGGIQWVYNDNYEMTYNKWHVGQPDGVGNENCIQGLLYQNGFWNDANCNMAIAAICYFEKSTDDSIKIDESQLVTLPQKSDYGSANYLCQQHGMKLIRIQNDETNNAVYNYALLKKAGEYWIDANDNGNEGLWVYNDGRRIFYNKWFAGQPGGLNNENCVHGGFYTNGFWNDISCGRPMTIICYFEKSFTKVGSQLVALGQKGDFYTAGLLCDQHGMRVVKIHNEETNKAVYEYAVQRGLNDYWIDASDTNSEGYWRYRDGSQLIYAKWGPGQPSGGYQENCASPFYYGNGLWDDVNCFGFRTIICYAESSPQTTEIIEENQLMYLVQIADYYKAISLCKQQGMELVKVENEESNRAVYIYAMQRRLGEYWIDGNDITTEGLWMYSDGTRIGYNKWYAGEPNGVANENCLQGAYYKSGFWNDVACTKRLPVICYKPKPKNFY